MNETAYVHVIMVDKEYDYCGDTWEESYPVAAFLNLQGALDWIADIAKEFSASPDESGYSVAVRRTNDDADELSNTTYYIETMELED